MSAYTYTVLNDLIFMEAEAWIDDIDVDAIIVYGLRNTDGTDIINGTAPVTVDSLTPILYSDELDISGLGLIEGQRYDLFIDMQVARVSPTPQDGILNGHMQKITLSMNVLIESDKSFAFQSQAAGADEVFYAGGYNLFSGNNDFDPPIAFGTGNVAYAAHFFVVLGENAVDEITLTIAGTSITDAGVRTTSDEEDIIIPASAVVNDYFETSKKWLGEIIVVKTTGTEKQCNFGYAKYWDNSNSDFIILGFDTTWFGGANDDIDFVVYHHKDSGWTYNAGAEPSPPELLRMTDDYTATDDKTISGAFLAWKRDNLSQKILGGDGEGIILSAISTKAAAFQMGNTVIRVRA